MFTGRTPLITCFLLAILAVGSFRAARFAMANPGSRAVYNLDIDTSAYDALALELSATRDLHTVPTTQPPGFIVLLAGIYSVFGHSYTAVKLVFCGLLVATAALAAWIGWRRVGPVEGLLAAALIVFSPMLVSYAATLQYEIPAAFLSMLLTALVLADPKPGSPGTEYAWAALAALICAVAALVREVLLVLFPLALLAIVIRQARLRGARPGIMAAAVMLVVFLAPVALWSWMQFERAGRVVFISDKSDLNLRIGNNPAADGAYHLQLGPILEPSGWRFIRENPPAAGRLALRKVMYFWGLARDPWTVPHRSAVVLSRALGSLVPFHWVLTLARGGILMILFIAGAILLLRMHRPGFWVLPAVVLAVMGVHILYFSSQRFAVPVQPQIYLCAAVALAGGCRWLLRRGRPGLVVVALAIVWTVVAQSIWWPGSYVAEAEDLEGIAAQNSADPLAGNGISRFGGATAGPRRIAFFVAETYPKGAFAVRVRARTEACASPDSPALEVTMRNQDGVSRISDVFTVADLCPGGYKLLVSPGILRADEIVDLSIKTTGKVDVLVDSVEILFGYRRRDQLPTE